MSGDSSLDPMLDYELHHFPDTPKLFVDLKLTDRQIDYLAFEYRGKSAKETSIILHIDESTHSNSLGKIRDKIRDSYRTLSAFIKAAEAGDFLTKRCNNLHYIHELNDVLSKFKSKNTLIKEVDIYYKNDTPLHYVDDLELHLETAGFKIGEIYPANDKPIVDKNTVSVYIYTQGGYKPSAGDLEYDHVIETHVSGYVTSLFNFVKEYCDRRQVEEERVKHRLYIYDGVNYEYFPKDMIKLLDDMKSGKYRVPREWPLLEDLCEPLIKEVREVHDKMKTKHKLLPMLVYASVGAIFGTTLYALYPKPEDDVLLEQNLKIAEDILLDRDSLLNKLAKELSAKNSKIVALIGAGGAGKTTLARLHLKKHRKDSEKIVFEINAETEESLYGSLSDMCYRLVKTDQDTKEWELVQKASNQKDKNKRLIKFVRRKLLESDKWMLVFDNTEDLNCVTEVVPSDSGLYKKGKVLVTTRNQNIKSVKTLKGEELKCIDVGELADQEKYKLFTLVLSKLSDKKYAQTEVEKFLEKIPNYPLDVVSVACYLASSAITLQEYASKMKEVSSHFNEIKKELMSEATSYGKTRYGIVAVTLEKILQDLKNEEVYKNLLLLISMCDSQNIPIELLEKCSSEDDVKLLIHELKKHSFISFNNDSLSIHRSIQEFWFLILKNKIDEKSFDQFMGTFFEKAVSVSEVNHMYYKMNVIQRDRKWYAKMMPHLEFLSKKINVLDTVPISNSSKYLVNMLIVMATMYEKHGVSMDKIYDTYNRALTLDKKYSVLSGYEKSLLLGQAGFFGIVSHNISDIKELIESVNIAKTLQGAEPLVVMNSINLGIVQILRGDYKDGMKTFENALPYSSKNGELWQRKAYVQIKSLMYKYLLFRNLNNKAVVLKCIDEFIDMINILDPEDSLHTVDSKNRKEISSLVPILKRNLTIAYNVIGDFVKTKEIYGDSELICNLFPNTSRSVYLEAKSEYGKSILRSNKVNNAYKVLKFVMIEMVQSGMSKGETISTIASITEAMIRLNEPLEKILDILAHIVLSDYSPKETREQLCYTDCLYNAAFASYKVNKLDDTKKYFDVFMQNIHELCERLISEVDRKKLESEGAFKEQTDIETYLLNAYKIYAAIFGENHAFVKDYVRKNVQDDTTTSYPKLPVKKVENPAAAGA